MITEDYVSFQIAKLLKEKGFDEKCHAFYRKTLLNNKIIDTAELHISTHLSLTNSNLQDKLFKEIVYCEAPTLQMAMKWLREVHNRHISIEHSYILNKYRICITKYNPDNISDLNNTLYFSAGYDFSIYEEACEAAIKYCLENLI